VIVMSASYHLQGGADHLVLRHADYAG
jgi:hypothetical protein